MRNRHLQTGFPWQPGFTLIELMVVLVIVGILSAIAYPSYVSYVAKARRADAAMVLMENAQWMERYFTQNNSYLNVAANPVLPILEAPKDGSAKFYDIAFSGTNTQTTYTLTATPKGSMSSDACGTLTLTEAGVKGTSGATLSVDACWKR